MWRTRLLKTIALCVPERALHTNYRLCTGLFGLPVGDVGKWGWLTPHSIQISKTPELHSADLENPTAGQVDCAESFRKSFHFSCVNYGDYYLFF